MPIAGGPFEPPGKLDAVDPLSESLDSALREAAVLDEPDAALFGVLKRFNAVESAEPPDVLPVAPDAPAAPLADVEEEAELEELCEESEEELLEEEDELEVPKVGVLEIAVVVALDADGSVALGLRREPRNCGTISAA